MNITEDFCSFEVYKLLKEKGFNGEIHTTFDEEGYTRPSITHQMAMKWLREMHNLSVETFSIKGTSDVCPIFWKSNVVALLTQERTFSGELVYSYEEAVEEALKYVLENLI